MTLDEAIIHAEEVAERQETNANSFENGDDFEKSLITNCLECAKEHRQIAEWLKELKAYWKREQKEIRNRCPIVWEFGEGVIRCLTIIEDCLEEVKADGDSN